MVTIDAKEFECFEPAKLDGEIGRLGPYRISGLIGKGGMGFVVVAEDTRLQRDVALKVMNQKYLNTPGSRHRFLEEARAMARVNHDNVVTIYEVGQFNETPFMAMELLHGQSVEHLNECVQEESQRPLSPEQIVQLAIDVSRGLSACHARGVVHRDVKPGNVWIEAPSGRVQLLDFGLAMRNTPTGQLAGIGTVLGTPGYLSPEQAAGEPLDDRTDIYSLGVVLYELCCGELPMLAKTVNAQLISIIAHEPPPLRERNPAVPVPLADLIHQMLQKRPQDRPRGSIALESMFHDVATEMSAPAPLPSVSVPENFHETTSIVATRDTVSDRSDAVRVETTTVELATSGSRGPAASPSVRSRQPRMGLRRGAGTSSLLRNKNVVIGASVLTMVATIVALAYLANYMGSSPVEDTEINRVSNQQNNSTVALRPNINDTPTTDQRSKPNPNSDANQSTPTDNTGDGNPIPPPSLAGDASATNNDTENNTNKNNTAESSIAGSSDAAPRVGDGTNDANAGRMTPSDTTTSTTDTINRSSVNAGNAETSKTAAGQVGAPTTNDVAMGNPAFPAGDAASTGNSASVTETGNVTAPVMDPASNSNDVEATAPLLPPGNQTSPTTVTILRTTDGYGADTSLRKEPLGEEGYWGNRKIFVSRPANKQYAVTYGLIRFDLSKIDKTTIQRAGLMLTLAAESADDQPAKLRVYVVPPSILGPWKQRTDKQARWDDALTDSYINRSTLVCEMEVDNTGGRLVDEANALRVNDPRLNEFMRQYRYGGLTMLLVCEHPKNRGLRFYASESGVNTAPALVLDLKP